MTDSNCDELRKKKDELLARIDERHLASQPKTRDQVLFWSTAITTVAGILLSPPTGGTSLVVSAVGIALLGIDIGSKAWDRKENQKRMAALRTELALVEEQLGIRKAGRNLSESESNAATSLLDSLKTDAQADSESEFNKKHTAKTK